MAHHLRLFENSLKDYLVSAMMDAYTQQHQLLYRYNNLRVFIDTNKVKTPHFFVSLGISEACFSMDDMNKAYGCLGSDEKYIMRWALRPNINGELRKQWMHLNTPVVDEDEITEEMLAVQENNMVRLIWSGRKKRPGLIKRYRKYKRLLIIKGLILNEDVEENGKIVKRDGVKP